MAQGGSATKSRHGKDRSNRRVGRGRGARPDPGDDSQDADDSDDETQPVAADDYEMEN